MQNKNHGSIQHKETTWWAFMRKVYFIAFMKTLVDTATLAFVGAYLALVVYGVVCVATGAGWGWLALAAVVAFLGHMEVKAKYVWRDELKRQEMQQGLQQAIQTVKKMHAPLPAQGEANHKHMQVPVAEVTQPPADSSPVMQPPPKEVFEGKEVTNEERTQLEHYLAAMRESNQRVAGIPVSTATTTPAVIPQPGLKVRPNKAPKAPAKVLEVDRSVLPAPKPRGVPGNIPNLNPNRGQPSSLGGTPAPAVPTKKNFIK